MANREHTIYRQLNELNRELLHLAPVKPDRGNSGIIPIPTQETVERLNGVIPRMQDDESLLLLGHIRNLLKRQTQTDLEASLHVSDSAIQLQLQTEGGWPRSFYDHSASPEPTQWGIIVTATDGGSPTVGLEVHGLVMRDAEMRIEQRFATLIGSMGEGQMVDTTHALVNVVGHQMKQQAIEDYTAL